jgi:uncharacterized protein YndB with AHSA1/START domain
VSLREITLRQSFAASPERVWSAITDHAGMSKWAGAEVLLVANGDANGVGAVRRMKIGGLRIDEEVIYADAPRRLVYKIVRGLPVNFHRGEMILEPNGERTELTWRILMGSSVPGLVRTTGALLKPALSRGLRELAGLIGA